MTTMREYPCGCSATGEGPIPGYCPTHGKQDELRLELHRCKVCGTRWLLWPDAIHGGGWNLLDKYQRPGSCCDNAALGDQIEHLRDLPLSADRLTAALGSLPPQFEDATHAKKESQVPQSVPARPSDADRGRDARLRADVLRDLFARHERNREDATTDQTSEVVEGPALETL